MVAGLIGKKIGMTQIFNEQGRVVPVTVIEAGPCYIVQKKESEKDGYNAVQLGFGKKERKLTKPEVGHFKTAGKGVIKRLKEFRVSEEELKNHALGDELSVSIFTPGEKVKVTGRSKGRGFAGVMKRWNFGGGRKTHGSRFHRSTGSIGQCVNPGKVFKNKKMPGHYGNEQVTVKGLEVVKISPEQNILMVKGAIPGAPGGLVYIKK